MLFKKLVKKFTPHVKVITLMSIVGLVFANALPVRAQEEPLSGTCYVLYGWIGTKSQESKKDPNLFHRIKSEAIIQGMQKFETGDLIVFGFGPFKESDGWDRLQEQYVHRLSEIKAVFAVAYEGDESMLNMVNSDTPYPTALAIAKPDCIAKPIEDGEATSLLF